MTLPGQGPGNRPTLRSGYFRSEVPRLPEVEDDFSEPEDVLRLVEALRLVPELDDSCALSDPESVSSPRPREPDCSEDPLLPACVEPDMDEPAVDWLP